MTIKSIATILDELEAAGDLLRFVPVFDPDEGEKRRLYVSREVYGFLHGQHKDKRAADYYAAIRASLGEFVKGEPIPDDEKTFKRLVASHDSPLADIWEFRVTFDPQSRVFGAFAAHDCFVAFTAKFRRDCHNGGFTKAMTVVRDRWIDRFGSHPRYRGQSLAYCISNCGG